MANKAIKGKIGSDTVYFVPYFPVGSIYITISEDNPSTIFGGTWEKIEGKFLLGASTSYKVNTTGGSTSHTHSNSSTGSTTLTSSHIPQHSHTYAKATDKTGGTAITVYQMPAHKHGFEADGRVLYWDSGLPAMGGLTSDGSSTHVQYTWGSRTLEVGGGEEHTHTISTSSTSTGNWGTASPSGHTHTLSSTGSSSTLPPYITVYIWKRTK